MDRILELYNMAEPPVAETITTGTHNGYEFIILWYRNHPNAYIRIPEGHPYYKKDYRRIEDRGIVHWGFTFSGKNLHRENGLPDGWYLGWDYAHLGDYTDYRDGYTLDGRRWTVEAIATECKQIIDEIIKEAK
jgi:hypothetical protein